MRNSALLFVSFLFTCFLASHAREVINVNWAGVLDTGLESANCTKDTGIYCGNNRCEENESPCSCACDCGPCCVDGFCRRDLGENFDNCPQDCALSLKVVVVNVYDNTTLSVSPFNPSAPVSVICYSKTSTYGPENVNSDGSYTFDGVPAGWYTCTATTEGFVTNSQAVSLQLVDLTQNRAAIIPLQAQLGSASGNVTSGLAPLSGARINCVSNTPNGPTYFRLSESPYGAFFFFGAVPGTYTCTATKNAFNNATSVITIVAGQNTLVNFQLTPLPGTILGRVFDTLTGFGANGVLVDCGEGQVGSTITSPTGFFIVVGLPSGPNTCVAYQVGYISGRTTVVVPQGGSANATIYVTIKPSVLLGDVKNADNLNELITDAEITCLFFSPFSPITEDTLPLLTYTTLSDSVTAAYSLSGLIKGNWTCTVKRVGFFSQTAILPIPIDSEYRRDWRLTPLPSIVSGLVRDKWSGLPINEATIVCIDDIRKIETGRRGSAFDGTFSINPLIGGGENKCTFEKFEYFPELVCDRIIRGTSYFYDVLLTPRTGNLTGIVRETYTNGPVFNVTVTCSVPAGSNTTSTNTTGGYFLGPIRIGNQYCTFNHPQYYPFANFTTIVYNTTTTFNANLVPLPAFIRVEVYDQSLGLLIPANVSCILPRGQRNASVTNFLGIFDIPNVNVFGAATCQATRPGYNPSTVVGFTILFGTFTRVILNITPQAAGVGGIVSDSVTGIPIASAVVDCGPNDVRRFRVITSSGNGTTPNYIIANLDRGDYGCFVNARGYINQTSNFRLNEGQFLRKDYQLMPLPGNLTVRVLDNGFVSLPPISGALVVCSNGSFGYNLTTDSLGYANFTNIQRGNYICTGSFAFYTPTNASVILLPGETNSTTILLDPLSARVSGTVFSNNRGQPLPAGTPPIVVPGATIAVFDSVGRTVRSVQTQADGTYFFLVRVPFRYTVNISAPLYFGASNIPIGNITRDTTINFSLTPSDLIIAVNVTEADTGRPITTAAVTLSLIVSGGDPTTVGAGLTDSTGVATFRNLAPGTYSARISKSGYNDNVSGLIAASFYGRLYSTSATLSLRSGSVSGAITTTGPDNLADFLVTIQGTTLSKATDSNGGYFFENVAPGSYVLTVEKAGYNRVTQPFVLAQGSAARIPTLLVTRQTGTIRGNIYRRGTNQPIGGAGFTLQLLLGNTEQSVLRGSGTQTAYNFDGLLVGATYRLIVNVAQGTVLIPLATVDVNIPSPTPVVQDIEVTPPQ